MRRSPSPCRPRRNCADDLEPLFQDNLLGRPMPRPIGSKWIPSHLGILHSALQGNRRPPVDPCSMGRGQARRSAGGRAGTAAGGTSEASSMTRKVVDAPKILQMFREMRSRAHPQRAFPMMCLHTIRRLSSRWGLLWRWRRNGRRLDVGPPRQFSSSPRSSTCRPTEGVEPAGIVGADATAVLPRPQVSTGGPEVNRRN
jgi:hypothetical protein